MKTHAKVALASSAAAAVALGLLMLRPLEVLQYGFWAFLLAATVGIGGTAAALVSLGILAYRSGRRRMLAGYLVGLALAGMVIAGAVAIQHARRADEYQVISVGGVERQYRIYVPSYYNGSSKVPLLLALHGALGSAQQFESESGFDAVAERYGFIVAYPDGLGRLKYSLHFWNSGYINAGLKGGADDVGFLTALVEQVESDYEIDASRVYIAGHSNGGMMAYRMAAERPELFAAAAPVSASIGGYEAGGEPYQIPEPDSPVSIVHVHGYLDRSVLYAGGETQSGADRGRIDLPVSESIAFWVAQDGCPLPPSSESSANGWIVLTKYAGGEGGAEVSLVTLMRQDHFWSNMDSEVASEQFHGGSLAEMLWNLVKAYSSASK